MLHPADRKAGVVETAVEGKRREEGRKADRLVRNRVPGCMVAIANSFRCNSTSDGSIRSNNYEAAKNEDWNKGKLRFQSRCRISPSRSEEGTSTPFVNGGPDSQIPHRRL